MMVDVGTVDIEQVKINRRGSCLAAPSDEGAPEGWGREMLAICTILRWIVQFFGFFSPSGLRPPSSSEEGTNLEAPTVQVKIESWSVNK